MTYEKTTILDVHAEKLERATAGLVSFNDVFPEKDYDFDAELTTQFRHLSVTIPHFTSVPIGENLHLSEYGSVTIDDLISERTRILHEAIRDSKPSHPDLIRAELESQQAVLGILNRAPRNNETTNAGRNGKDFYLAITDNGVEFYTVPADLLSALETRNRILGLYRIPTAKIPFTDGKNEQFRSSLIANVRYRPEILVPVYQYASRADLITAKTDQEHSSPVPEQKSLLQPAFVDKFGNVRLSISNDAEFRDKIDRYSRDGVVGIGSNITGIYDAHLVHSLKDIPEGELGLYSNVADSADPNSPAAYWELVVKLKDPNNPNARSAAGLLELEHLDNWDPEDFVISLPEGYEHND